MGVGVVFEEEVNLLNYINLIAMKIVIKLYNNL